MINKLLCMIFGHKFEYMDGHFQYIGLSYYGKYNEVYKCKRCNEMMKKDKISLI